MATPVPVLGFDFASPRASLALASDGELLAAEETAPGDEADLLRRLDALLRAAALTPRDLGGVVALAGPGSFTGLRIACSTAWALGQATGVPVGGLSTLAALAWSAPADDRPLLAAVDALRGEWFVQAFGPARGSLRPPLEEARLWRPGEPLGAPDVVVVAHDAARLLRAAGAAASAIAPAPLAAAAAVAATRDGWVWRPELLTRPAYLRAPAVARPGA